MEARGQFEVSFLKRCPPSHQVCEIRGSASLPTQCWDCKRAFKGYSLQQGKLTSGYNTKKYDSSRGEKRPSMSPSPTHSGVLMDLFYTSSRCGHVFTGATVRSVMSRNQPFTTPLPPPSFLFPFPQCSLSPVGGDVEIPLTVERSSHHFLSAFGQL